MTNRIRGHSGKQPEYHTNKSKFSARAQIIAAYRHITGLHSIPPEKGYWTLCNRQPSFPPDQEVTDEASEIVQLEHAGFLKKQQFFGIDNDLRNEGIIEDNRKDHPEAHWFDGDFLETIAEQYDIFNPAMVYFDGTRTIATKSCHVYVARVMELCPSKTVVAVNLMLCDGHSSKKFDPKILVEGVMKHIRNSQDWIVSDQYFPYKSKYVKMGTFVFTRK